MEELRLGAVERQFADIIWQNEPIPSGELVKLCEQKLEWKKSTTYTMLKRLCERGIFKNENGVVSSVLTKEEFGAAQSEKIIEDSSTPKATRISSSEMVDVRAAMPSSTKKMMANSVPAGMLLNTLGNTM